MEFSTASENQLFFQEEIGDYVAQLQLHMTLQAKNLVPSLHSPIADSRARLLQETQTYIEKLASRQVA